MHDDKSHLSIRRTPTSQRLGAYATVHSGKPTRHLILVHDRLRRARGALDDAGTSLERPFVEDVVDKLVLEERAAGRKTERLPLGLDQHIPPRAKPLVQFPLHGRKLYQKSEHTRYQSMRFSELSIFSALQEEKLFRFAARREGLCLQRYFASSQIGNHITNGATNSSLMSARYGAPSMPT